MPSNSVSQYTKDFRTIKILQTLLYQQSFDVDTSSTADTLEAYPEFDFFGGGSNPVIVSNNQLIVHEFRLSAATAG